MNKIESELKEIFGLFDSINSSNLNIDDKVKIESILVKNMLFKETQLKQQKLVQPYHLYHQRVFNRKELLNIDKYLNNGEFY